MIGQIIASAFQSLWTKKTRSVLTMLGVIIGVAQIIALIGLGNGIKKDIASEITQLGTNVLFIIPGKVQTSSGGFNPAASVGASTLTDADVVAIRQLPDITDVMVMGLMAALPTAGTNQAAGAMVLAAQPNFLGFVNMYKIANGRFFTAAENDAMEKVIVLGKDAALQLFPDVDAAEVIGKTVTLGKNDFTVVGTVESTQTNSLFSSPGSGSVGLAIVPFKTAKDVNQNTQIFRIGVKASDSADAKAVKATISAKLKDLHGADDTTVFTQDDLLKVVDSILGLITKAIVALASISLVVGGIGIMNIMLVAVSERTKEIGVRKALGATRSSILGQFLTESVVLGLVGGAIGVGIVSVASTIVRQKAGVTIVVDWYSILVATLFSIGVGVIFGLLPAVRAARKDPIEALRYE